MFNYLLLNSLFMKKTSNNLKKLIIIIILIFTSIVLYSNKPYSLFEINRVGQLDDIDIQSVKEYYKRLLNDYEKQNIKDLTKSFYVKKNENIGLILSKINLSTPTIILKKTKKNCFYNLKVKDQIKITYNENKIISIIKKDKKNECVYESKNDSIEKITIKPNRNTKQMVFFNNIQSSFYNSALQSGLNPNEIMSLADIFGWDIDFVQDIRKDDSFGVVIDRVFSDKTLNNSLIKYAIFKNRKKTFEAYYFNGKYFTKTGNSMRKQFLRAPIDFYRISSRFNKKRLHPIFKTIRPHLGTDYAAPTGTPIYSTGDGKIIFKGTKGGYGKTIIIKHGNIYSTLYAHMSKYKKGIYVGKKVKQKEVIGYVGSTGYSTGPHVHYEFRVRGKHKNSLKVKFKKGKKLNKKNVRKMHEIHSVNESIYSWLKEAYK